MKHILTISNLHVSIQGKAILQGMNLTVSSGEIAALMGPNGSGKSTLANVLAGNPEYEVTAGSIHLDHIDLLALSPEERAAAGIFLAFQYPPSIPGVSISHFLRIALNSQEKANGQPITGIAPFIRILRSAMKLLEIPVSFAERNVNEGFSGGEKKRLEILQMLILKPKFIILDEIDSGLDIDAIKTVASAINQVPLEEAGVIIITHYQRILRYTQPTQVHIIKDGSIIRSGGPEIAEQLEEEGYTSLTPNL